MSSHSISASMIYKKERRHKTGHYKTYQNEFVDSSREQTRLHEEFCEKRKLFEKSRFEICPKCEE